MTKARRPTGRRRRVQLRVAILGSVGKTTVGSMIETALVGQATCTRDAVDDAAAAASCVKAKADVVIAECQVTGPGAWPAMVKALRPDIVVVTDLSARNLAAFGDTEGLIADAAAALRAAPRRARAIVPADDPVAGRLVAARKGLAKTVTYGVSRRAHHRVTDLFSAQRHSTAQLRGWRTPMMMKTAGPGAHLAVLGAAAVTCVWALGLDRARALCNLAGWAPAPGMGDLRVLHLDSQMDEEQVLVFDGSAHTSPQSARAAVEIGADLRPVDGMGRFNRGRRIAVLGAMPGLGDHTERVHRDLAQTACLQRYDKVHTVGDGARVIHDLIPQDARGLHVPAVSALLPHLRRLVDGGDALTIRGAPETRLHLVVDAVIKLGHRRA